MRTSLGSGSSGGASASRGVAVILADRSSLGGWSFATSHAEVDKCGGGANGASWPRSVARETSPLAALSALVNGPEGRLSASALLLDTPGKRGALLSPRVSAALPGTRASSVTTASAWNTVLRSSGRGPKLRSVMQALPSRDAATSLGHRRRRLTLDGSSVCPFALRTSGGAMDRVGPSLVTRARRRWEEHNFFLLLFGTSCGLLRTGDRPELRGVSHAVKGRRTVGNYRERSRCSYLPPHYPAYPSHILPLPLNKPNANALTPTT